MKAFWFLSMVSLITPALAGLEPGDGIQVTLRGVEQAEQNNVNGTYRVGDSGQVRLPLLDRLVTARGLTPEQFARAAEAAYRAEGIYTKPAIEVEALQGGEQDKGPAMISIGGQIRRGGESPFRRSRLSTGQGGAMTSGAETFYCCAGRSSTASISSI